MEKLSSLSGTIDGDRRTDGGTGQLTANESKQVARCLVDVVLTLVTACKYRRDVIYSLFRFRSRRSPSRRFLEGNGVRFLSPPLDEPTRRFASNERKFSLSILVRSKRVRLNEWTRKKRARTYNRDVCISPRRKYGRTTEWKWSARVVST